MLMVKVKGKVVPALN